MIQLPDLRSMLGNIPWVLVGGIALRAYAPERDTRAIDVLIHERARARAQAVLLAAGYRLVGDLLRFSDSLNQESALLPAPACGSGAGGEGATVAPAEPTGMPLGVRARTDRWLDTALAIPGTDPAGYPVLARPYLLLLKLQAGRTQDLADVQRLLGSTPADARVALRALVQRERPDLLEDYDSLAMLADLEFGPPHGPHTGQHES